VKHLLSTADLDHATAVSLLDTAEAMAETQRREIKKLPTLRGRTVVNLFFEDSTRTRISFEAAAKRLSADVINFSAKGSSVSKGESLKDTAETLQAMGADAVVIRHPASGAPHRLAAQGWTTGAVLNAGDGTHEHPTQALLDAFTLRRHLRGGEGDLAGLRVAVVGDVLHSRVARSNVHLLRTLGRRSRWSRRPRCCRGAWGRGRARPRSTSTRSCRRGRRHDAAGPGGTDERGLLPLRAGVLAPLRPGRPAAAAAARPRDRHAPRAR
jgi:aspartate carbamoyltransferase